MKVLFCVGVVKREVSCDFVPLFGFAGIATFETSLTVPSVKEIEFILSILSVTTFIFVYNFHSSFHFIYQL